MKSKLFHILESSRVLRSEGNSREYHITDTGNCVITPARLPDSVDVSHLYLCDNQVTSVESESLAGVMTQFAALTHPNLHNKELGTDREKGLTGVMGK